jgi:sporulation protein YqfC
MERTLCIPEGTLYAALRMEFTANRRVVVEGYRRILQYEEHRIVLDTVEGQVAFEGDALCVNCLEDHRAAVGGHILTVSFAEL